MEFDKNYIPDLCKKAKDASFSLSSMSTELKDKILNDIAVLIEDNIRYILEENKKDVDSAEENGLRRVMLDRLKLTEERIRGICSSLRELIQLSDPIGSGSCIVRPNGLKISHVRAPLGCIAMIYEARPNVTVDASSLCLKTGNAVVLRGGKEALNSNIALVKIMRKALSDNKVDPNAISLVEKSGREYTNQLMTMRGYLDALIPRGGEGLIKSVVESAKVPVIETGAGNCHMYIDDSADIDMALNLSVSAKISRPSVCNSLEKLLVDEKIAPVFLPLFEKEAAKHNLEIRGCDTAREYIKSASVLTDEDLYTEYNDYIIGVMVVKDLREAVEHINKYSTHHSEAIVTSKIAQAEYFKANVDSAAVYVNASTRFTDGNVFGLGAEIGISTQKLHARGPMGMYALTTDKFLIDGNGQTR